MPTFFSKFPSIAYDVERNGKPIITKNILTRFAIRSEIKTNGDFYSDYIIQDSDRPDLLALDFYGSTDHYWVVLMMNDMVDPYHDWPMDQLTLERWSDKKWPNETFFLWNVNGSFLTGETVTTSRGSAGEVLNWDATYRRMDISFDNGPFIAGDTITGSQATGILKRRVQEAKHAVDHFSEDAEPTSPWLDPHDTTGLYLQNYATQSIDTYAVTRWVQLDHDNEQKREIKILKPEVLPVLLKDVDRVMTSRGIGIPATQFLKTRA